MTSSYWLPGFIGPLPPPLLIRKTILSFQDNLNIIFAMGQVGFRNLCRKHQTLKYIIEVDISISTPSLNLPWI